MKESKSQKPRGRYGEGTIYKRNDGRFEGTFFIDGVKKSVYGRTEKEAYRKLKEAKKKAEEGMLLPSNKMRVADYLEEWLESQKHPTAHSTYMNYSYAIRGRINPVLGTTRLQSLTIPQVQKFINALVDDGMKPSSVRYIHTLLSTAMNAAVEKKYISFNPCKKVSLPRKQKRKPQVLDERQARAFLEAVEGQKVGTLVTLALVTGLRRGELMGLRWSDIDFEKGVLTVENNAVHIAFMGIKEGPPKTESGLRDIPLVPFALDALRKHRTEQIEQRSKMGASWVDNNLVFPGKNGKHTPPETVRYRFKKALKQAGLPDMRLHDLRHSCATLLYHMGVPLKDVQAILGHSNMSITANIYTQVLPGKLRESMNTLNTLWEKEPKKDAK